MTRVLHVIVGPAQHGVVRHATAVAHACGHDVLRAAEARDAVIPAGYAVVHFAFTDHLFGPDCRQAAATFETLIQPLLDAGCRISLTIHDVPVSSDGNYPWRRAAYEQVLANATGIVVSSYEELSRIRGFSESAKSLCVIPLPVPRLVTDPPLPGGKDVAVLGFIYPDRGYEAVLDELPTGYELLAIGRPAADHGDLLLKISTRARQVGRSWRSTGFVPDEELPSYLARVAVPVAPNRQVAASASIATWLSHCRRPLVPSSGYTEEIATRWPGTLELYDADRPGALGDAITRAVADPAWTTLAADVKPGASLAEVAAEYQSHLEACATPVAIPKADAGFVVPANGWRLLDGYQPPTPPTVSVVIPYFESQRQLDLVLTALTLQTHPHSRLQVVVADDGSSTPPDLRAAGSLETQLVRQANQGFRAAAARNLGAQAAEGDVLAFLDSDTVPEPDYLTHLARLPSLLAEAVVVGRRRHADLTHCSPNALKDWLTQAPGAVVPRLLTEPSWLSDAYRSSHDLSNVDFRSYRFVISAVAAMSREFFMALDGFCEEFTSYGGEDWELAHRAYCCGAVLSHVRDAIAWHDGPDWAERPGDKVATKATETLMLVRLLPDRQQRGAGQFMPFPATVITFDCHDRADLEQTAASAFASGADCGFWLRGPHAGALAESIDDPRIQAGPVPALTLQRARVVFELRAPADLRELPGLEQQAETAGTVRTPVGNLYSSNALRRAERHADVFGGDVEAAVHRLFGRRDADSPRAEFPH
jgi:GT2 family glycosyltransferase